MFNVDKSGSSHHIWKSNRYTKVLDAIQTLEVSSAPLSKCMGLFGFIRKNLF